MRAHPMATGAHHTIGNIRDPICAQFVYACAYRPIASMQHPSGSTLAVLVTHDHGLVAARQVF